MNVELQLGEGDIAESQSPLPGELQVPLAEILEGMIVEVCPDLAGRERVEISLAFVDAKTMADFNSRYRESDGPTDVLSFPQWEDERGHFSPPQWPVLPLGDVVICDDVVRANAASSGQSHDAERVLIILHGVLHLLGLDHDDSAAEERMWEIQNRYRDLVMARFGRSG